MAKEDLIEKIITNGCSCFQVGDEAILNEFDEDRLQEIVDNSNSHDEIELVANAATTGFIDPVGNKHIFVNGEWLSEMVEVPTDNGRAKPDAQTADEWFASAPPEVQRVVQNALKAEREEKESLVETLTENLTGNEKARLTTNLLGEPIEKLRDLVMLIPRKRTAPPTGSMFPPVVPVGNKKETADDDLLLMPTINWEAPQ